MFTIHYSSYSIRSTSIVSSTLPFGLACWEGNLVKHDREQLNNIIKTASVVIGKEQEEIDAIIEH